MCRRDSTQENCICQADFLLTRNAFIQIYHSSDNLMVLAADGVYSPTARISGWKNETRHLAPALEYEVYVTDAEFKKHKDIVRFDIDAIKSGYGWSFPKKDHLSVGVGAFGVDKKKTDLKNLCSILCS